MTRTLVEHDVRSLPDDVEQLKTLVLDLLDHSRDLEHRLQLLLRQRFGSSAERIDPDQLKLFATEILEAGAAEAAEPSTTTIPEPARRNGRRKLPADLPRIRVEHDLDEQERPCPCCGEQRRKIGEETSELLEYEPATMHVVVACSPKSEPGLVRVPMTPGRGILETLDEAKATHS